MSNHPYDEKTIARFWAKVNRNGPVPSHRPELGPCWIWTASCYRNGYGQLTISKTKKLAHRVGFEITKGPIVGGEICHSCDVRNCVNPNHLWIGTRKANIHDCMQKGRKPRPPVLAQFANGQPYTPAFGQNHGIAKLDNKTVEAIRAAALSEPQSSIAMRFNIAQSNVSLIVNRKTWRHVA